MNRTKEQEDVVALVLHDHQGIQKMLEAVPDIAERERDGAFRELVARLVAHEVAEEQTIYPALRSAAAGGDAIAHDRIAEQAEAEVLLRALEKTAIDDPEFWSLFRKLANAVLAHAQAEERTALWVLSSRIDLPERVRLGQRYRYLTETAPTHPHPLSPKSSTAERTIGSVMATGDRVRDAVSSARAHNPASGAVGPDDDVLTILEGEHRGIDLLLWELQAEAEAAPRTSLKAAISALSSHTAVELEVLYPQVRSNVDGGVDLVKQARLDHEEVAMSLLRLQKVPMTTDEFRTELAHAIEQVRAHVRQEEGEMFPALREVLSPVQLHQLGRKVARARRHAPTRPHPRSLKSALGARFADRIESLLDRVAVGFRRTP